MQELSQHQKEEYDRITIFLEQFMQPYQIYTIPDKQYLRRLSKESQSGEREPHGIL